MISARASAKLRGMWIRSKQEEDEVRALHEEALARIEGRDLEGARALAEQLKALRWSGAFEVLALAARAEGDLEGAVRVLDEGTAVAPQVWTLHQLRGNLLDALGRHGEAIEALDRALACPEPWVSSVRFNRAVARLRGGDAGGALADAEAVLTEGGAPPFALDAVRVAIDALAKLARTADAVALVETALAQAGDAEPAASALAGLYAVALARDERSADAVARAAGRAIEGGKGTAELAMLLDPLPRDDRAARKLRLVVEGRIREGGKRYGFLRVLSLVAIDPEDGLAIARRIEPTTIRAELAVHESTDEGPSEAPRGILHASGRILFEE